jgi:hypothetical protein
MLLLRQNVQISITNLSPYYHGLQRVAAVMLEFPDDRQIRATPFCFLKTTGEAATCYTLAGEF